MGHRARIKRARRTVLYYVLRQNHEAKDLIGPNDHAPKRDCSLIWQQFAYVATGKRVRA